MTLTIFRLCCFEPLCRKGKDWGGYEQDMTKFIGMKSIELAELIFAEQNGKTVCNTYLCSYEF